MQRRFSRSSVKSSLLTCKNDSSKTSKSAWRIVSPAAMACPPNFWMREGLRFETRSSASRKWNPVIERPDPRKRASPLDPSAGAKIIAGRLKRSFKRDATIPTTPWCQLAFHKQSAGRSSGSRSVRCARADSCIPDSITRRSRLMRSNSCEISRADLESSHRSNLIPRLISARRPAALSLGPIAKPRSNGLAISGFRPATSNNARSPGGAIPWRILFKPCDTKIRLLRSSCATSATVPSATRPNNCSSLGWVSLVKIPRWRSSARSAIKT